MTVSNCLSRTSLEFEWDFNLSSKVILNYLYSCLSLNLNGSIDRLSLTTFIVKLYWGFTAARTIRYLSGGTKRNFG